MTADAKAANMRMPQYTITAWLSCVRTEVDQLRIGASITPAAASIAVIPKRSTSPNAYELSLSQSELGGYPNLYCVIKTKRWTADVAAYSIAVPSAAGPNQLWRRKKKETINSR